ncbi:MAG: response regulator [Verrucomicrobia bacterium]|nr:response regulator [Verrucomicrobiota bacterium]
MKRDAKPILIADDNRSDAEALERIIRAANITNAIHVADTGREVVLYLAGRGSYSDRERFPFPTLLFLDLILPWKSGLEILQWIREREEPEFRALGIVVMTGFGNTGEIRQAYRLGAHSFLVKPVSKEDFLNLAHGLRGIRLNSAAKGRELHFSPD